ncbi:MAG: nucleoside triphosphate pyrophosphatase [Alphaproteobacteria bacterium]
MHRNEAARPVKIILASQSVARRTMLKNAGLNFKIVKPLLDEIALARELQGASPAKIALELAKKKALTVAAKNPDALVIGSDQILLDGGRIMTKAKTREDAREKLRSLRGKTHTLVSAAAVVKGGTVFWSRDDEAQLTMREFDDEFLDAYCNVAGDALTRAVGAYEIERAGAWLFSEVRGDHFTILGMPLRPLLAYLHEYHGVKP